MLGTYDHKFILPKGSQVFVPSALGRQGGAEVHAEVRRRWRPPHYFYHLRPGGHVAALRGHLHNRCFATLDVGHFFDSVTRAKVHRALRSIGIGHDRAWEIAQESTVEKTLRQRDFSLPYGFIQSPVLASLALDRSAFGRVMNTIARSNHTRLNCYVDDIILSGIEEQAVEDSRLVLVAAARRSEFVLNEAKSQRPSSAITAFNIVLSNGELAVTAERMHAFEDAVLSSGPASAAAIIAYVRSINRAQADELAEAARTSPDAEVRDLAAAYC
jgi:Reverse transcriptase (RNA-dependent DNA polymerase)